MKKHHGAGLLSRLTFAWAIEPDKGLSVTHTQAGWGCGVLGSEQNSIESNSPTARQGSVERPGPKHAGGARLRTGGAEGTISRRGASIRGTAHPGQGVAAHGGRSKAGEWVGGGGGGAGVG